MQFDESVDDGAVEDVEDDAQRDESSAHAIAKTMANALCSTRIRRPA